MEIFYANSRIEKICTDEKAAQKELGIEGARVLKNRLKQMRYAKNVTSVSITNPSNSGKRKFLAGYGIYVGNHVSFWIFHKFGQ